MSALIGAYLAVALIGAFMGAVIMVDDGPRELGSEGRVILGILAGALWPLIALACVAWLLRAGWLGIMQVVRLVRPTKTKLPRAEVRQ